MPSSNDQCLPPRIRAQFDGWTEAIVAANTAEGGSLGRWSPLGDALGEMMAYFTALIERRRVEPEDDTVSHLVAAGVGADGDIAGMLSILAFTFTMVTGGNDTTTGMLGGSVQLLHQRPDQRRLLADNPDLITDAVDEFLRLTSPAQGLARTATRDVRIGDTTIPEGRKVLLLYGSANRDERQYGADAGELDVRRRPRNILTFSHGAHHCLGAAAARMQSRVALTELLARCPNFEVDESGIVWAGGSYVRTAAVGSVPGDGVMAGNDWLGDRRTEVAADRILDAADALFAEQDAATVGMHEIAKAAGCSRATLYRYFENREALYTAYVHRESYRLFHQMTEQLTGVEEPRERLIEGMVVVAAQRARKPRAVIVVRHRAAADRCGDRRAVAR